MPTNPPTERFFSGIGRRLFFWPLTPLIIVALIGAGLWARQAGLH
jgi:hypothetical protein